MKRRAFIAHLIALTAGASLAGRSLAGDPEPPKEKIVRTEAEWKKLLTPEQYHILREEGTERAFTSPLDREYRKGTYVCAGCELPLFTSEMKFNSGTGWPSFSTSLPGSLETKKDFKLVWPRTEYHCARCGGHQGHVFDDGPKPTGQRWCNNGLALRFIPDPGA
jgi:peptide-methionine (R)-S-oxide reductase